MKRRSVIIGAAVVAAWLAIDLVREFVANETFRYFSSEPARLLYVSGIALCGGLAAWGFGRLSPRAQQSVKIFAWGGTAGTLTAFIAWLGVSLASLTTTGIESHEGLPLVAMLLFSGIVAYLWFEFYRSLKVRVPQ
jgi:uncharacterized membrane protein